MLECHRLAESGTRGQKAADAYCEGGKILPLVYFIIDLQGLEPCAVKVACTVLRGQRGRELPGLPESV